MENRRPNTSKPYGQKKYYDKGRENSSQYRTYSRNDDGGPRGTGDRPPRSGRPGFNRDNSGGYRKPGSSDGGRFFSRNPRQNLRAPFGKGKPKPWEQENKIKIVSDYQITDGKHRGKYLLKASSPTSVPTPRRIREIMFKILFRRVRAGRVLDLCAGGGTIGIEAISRGAMISTFVERSAKMCSLIRKNLESMGVKDGHGEINEIEAMPFLKRVSKRRRFWDVVYFSYNCVTEPAAVMDCLSRGTGIMPGGTLVIEHEAEKTMPEKLGVLKRWRVVAQDDLALSFYQRR